MVEHNQSQYYGNQYKFNGKELDSTTGMYYYGARYYEPRFSIFVSVDPAVEMTMEPYSYVGNNPIMFTDPTGMSAEPPTDYVNSSGNLLYRTNDGSNAVITVPDSKLKAFQSSIEGTRNKSKLDDKEWNFTMKKYLVGDWSQSHENTQSWFSTSEARMYASRYWQTGDYDFYDKAVSSHTSELRSDVFGWFLSIASSFHGINVANSIRASVSNDIGFTVGAARKGYDKMMNFGKMKVSAETFHREIKPNILSKSGNFYKIVGKNPDIKIEGGQIRLQGTGPYKGKSYNTGLNASDFFND